MKMKSFAMLAVAGLLAASIAPVMAADDMNNAGQSAQTPATTDTSSGSTNTNSTPDQSNVGGMDNSGSSNSTNSGSTDTGTPDSATGDDDY